MKQVIIEKNKLVTGLRIKKISNPTQFYGYRINLKGEVTIMITSKNSVFNNENYVLENDPIEKVRYIIDFWKRTSLENGFKTDAISSLACKLKKEGHRLNFYPHENPQSEMRSMLCKVEMINAEAKATCVSLTIKGKNLDKNRDFQFQLNVCRNPKIETKIDYKEDNLYDLWPQGIGYNTLSGCSQNFYEKENDSIERVQCLVDSWKRTALEHIFKSHAISTLSCKPSENAHILTFDNHTKALESKSKSVNCIIEKIKAYVFVGLNPLDTCVRLNIFGKNLDTAKDFEMEMEVYRKPEVLTNVSYSEKASTFETEQQIQEKSIAENKALSKNNEPIDFGGMKKGFLL